MQSTLFGMRGFTKKETPSGCGKSKQGSTKHVQTITDDEVAEFVNNEFENRTNIIIYAMQRYRFNFVEPLGAFLFGNDQFFAKQI